MNWDILPPRLRSYNLELRDITLEETERLFRRAAELGVLDEFADMFWSLLSVYEYINKE